LLAKPKEKLNGKIFNLSDFRTKETKETKETKKNHIAQTTKQQVFVFGDLDLQKKFAAITKKLEVIKELLRNSYK
jgi:hypothetical protein